jgi:hypothetical protein
MGLIARSTNRYDGVRIAYAIRVGADAQPSAARLSFAEGFKTWRSMRK